MYRHESIASYVCTHEAREQIYQSNARLPVLQLNM